MMQQAPTVAHGGSARVHDEAATSQELVYAARELEQLAVSSYGPHGRFKILQSNEEGTGSFVVTTSSAKLFTSTNLGMNSPGARVLVNMIASQRRSCGDGGAVICTVFTVWRCGSIAARSDALLSHRRATPGSLAEASFSHLAQW